MEIRFRPEEWSQQADALRRMARELLREEELADDLVQTACLAALERPPRVLSRAWLARVLHTSAQDEHRRRGRGAQALSRIRSDESPAVAPDACEIAQRLEMHETLSAAVRLLDEPYRRVVFLRYFEELPPAEIARRLGLPVKTVKTRLHRALARLRERLERQYGDSLRWQSALLPLALPEASLAPAQLALVGIGAGIMLKKFALLVVAVLGLLGLYRIVNSGGPIETAPRVEPGKVPVFAASDEQQREQPAPISAEESRTALVEQARSETPPHAEHGSLTVHVVWHDGQPAENIAVAFQTRTPGMPRNGLRRVVSDELGVVRAVDLPRGPIELRSDRGDSLSSEVIAGETRELRLEITERLDVQGKVVDEQGRAVTGAGIWLTTGMSDWLGGRVVTYSDAEGRFFVRSMKADMSLGALAAGFAPSALVDLELVAQGVPPAEVLLELVELGGALRVRVTSAGIPVPHALVAVGKAPRGQSMRLSGGFAEVWTPRTQVCDKEGFALFEGLAAGETALSVRARELPVWNGSALIVEGETAQLEVPLLPGVKVVGVVRDESGEPVPGAVIRVLDRAVDEHFIQTGQYDYYSAFGYLHATADENGEYSVGPAWPGSLHMYAMPRAREGLYGSILHVYRVAEADPGTTVVWDVDLTPGPTIEGRVIHSDGEAIPDVFVSVTNEETSARQSTTTTADGRFVFYNLEPAAYLVRVQLWDAPKDSTAPFAEHVWPDSGEVLLEASFSKPIDEAVGEVRFRFDDVAGRLAEGSVLTVMLNSDKGWFLTHYEMDGDQFVFEKVQPGNYKLSLLSGRELILASDLFELGAGEHLDLGTLETEAGGSLEIEVLRPLGTGELDPQLWIQHGLSGHGRALDLGADTLKLVEDLNTGPWSLTLSGEGLASAWADFEVLADQTASVQLELRAAVERTIEIAYPESIKLGELKLTAHDSAGTKLWESNDRRPADRGRPYRRELKLPLGIISLRVTTDAQVGGGLDCEMNSLEPNQPALRIELR